MVIIDYLFLLYGISDHKTIVLPSFFSLPVREGRGGLGVVLYCSAMLTAVTTSFSASS